MKEEKEEDKRAEVNELLKKNPGLFERREGTRKVGVDGYLAGSNRQL
jgi:hypothetical protein